MISLFVNRLTVIDASLLHPDRGLLGESWLLDVELEGSLDHQGMVLDFAQVKQQIKRTVDSCFDHRLLVPARYPGCQIIQDGHPLEVQFQLTTGEEIQHRSPASAVALIDAERIDETSLARAIEEALRPLLPDNVQRIRLRLSTEQSAGAMYQYSHGLKHHEGNCQRIAHGHRSRIRIFRNGEPAPDLEQRWAARWHDIYLANAMDLQARFQRCGVDYCRFAYTANQGLFELTLPERRCYLIDTDSTVENLASHIAQTLHGEEPDAHFRVQAFEGVGKGAIAEAG